MVVRANGLYTKVETGWSRKLFKSKLTGVMNIYF